jgi:hypothetical protein
MAFQGRLFRVLFNITSYISLQLSSAFIYWSMYVRLAKLASCDDMDSNAWSRKTPKPRTEPARYIVCQPASPRHPDKKKQHQTAPPDPPLGGDKQYSLRVELSNTLGFMSNLQRHRHQRKRSQIQITSAYGFDAVPVAGVCAFARKRKLPAN